MKISLWNMKPRLKAKICFRDVNILELTDRFLSLKTSSENDWTTGLNWGSVGVGQAPDISKATLSINKPNLTNFSGFPHF